MSTTARPSKGIDPIEAGTYQAVCFQVIDLGIQYNKQFDKTQPEIMIRWEIPSVRSQYESDGRSVDEPRVIHRVYHNILHEKSNLSRDLVSWRGKPFTEEEAEGFDVKNVLKVNCLLTIINTKKGQRTFANVAGVSKLMKEMPFKEPENEILLYDTNQGPTDIPDSLPDWIRDTIMKCEEFSQGGRSNPDYVGDDPEPVDDDSEIPF